MNREFIGKVPLETLVECPHFRIGFRDVARGIPYRSHYEFANHGMRYMLGRQTAAFGIGRGMGKHDSTEFMKRVVMVAQVEGI